MHLLVPSLCCFCGDILNEDEISLGGGHRPNPEHREAHPDVTCGALCNTWSLGVISSNMPGFGLSCAHSPVLSGMGGFPPVVAGAMVAAGYRFNSECNKRRFQPSDIHDVSDVTLLHAVMSHYLGVQNTFVARFRWQRFDALCYLGSASQCTSFRRGGRLRTPADTACTRRRHGRHMRICLVALQQASAATALSSPPQSHPRSAWTSRAGTVGVTLANK